jgi:hypothetical protein
MFVVINYPRLDLLDVISSVDVSDVRLAKRFAVTLCVEAALLKSERLAYPTEVRNQGSEH